MPLIDNSGQLMGHVPYKAVGSAPWITADPAPPPQPRRGSRIMSASGNDPYRGAPPGTKNRRPSVVEEPSGPAFTAFIPVKSPKGSTVAMQQLKLPAAEPYVVEVVGPEFGDVEEQPNDGGEVSSRRSGTVLVGLVGQKGGGGGVGSLMFGYGWAG